ncbi:hypothetical protein [Methylomonas koyamae]|uniref:hypothetical protein n=1 Tax=Methylomonas koyamae TaxID=702114 RepID=UPI0006D14084|nr:hypothetical protein [Methylomonas koyamae]BBL58505.1 hypothetical protein MKFW12EY_21180 [Methylomonas koyamae]
MSPIYRQFQHRIPTTDASDLEAAAGQVFMMANRSQALLAVLLKTLYEDSEPDSEQLIAIVEAVQGEAQDIKAMANLMAAAAMNRAQNATNAGNQANTGNLFEFANRRPETQADADRFSERKNRHTEGV